MRMDIPEVQSPQNPSTVVNYITKAPKGPKSEKQVLIVDWFSSALIVIITIGIIATYFISFNVSTDISIKDVTVNTIWFAVGTFSIGALTKKMFRRKGEKTEEYQKRKNLRTRKSKNSATAVIRNVRKNIARRIQKVRFCAIENIGFP